MLNEVTALEKDFSSRLQAAYSSDSDGKERGSIDKVKAAFTTWSAAVETDVLAPVRAGNFGAGLEPLRTTLPPLRAALDSAVSSAESAKLTAAKELYDASSADATRSYLILLLAFLGALATGIVV
jgi:hypothetical protein